MARKKQETEQDITILDPTDVTNYTQFVKELVDEGRIAALGRVVIITQLHDTATQEYIGAFLVVAGSMTAASSGPDYAWRKYVYVSKDWEDCFVFDNVTGLYNYMAHRHPQTLQKEYRLEGMFYRDYSLTYTKLDLSNWGQ